MLDVGPIMLCNRAGGREAVASLILKNQEKGMAWGHSSWVGGVCPGMLHKLSSHFACMACAESRLECRPNTPPPTLSLSVSIPFCHKHYSTAEVWKTERMCDIGCKPLFWLIKSNKKD